MLQRTILVLVTVECESWTAHASQIVIEAPTGEGGCEPGINPSVKNPMRFFPMVTYQALEPTRLLEIRFGGANTGKSAAFNEALSRLSHNSDAAFGPARCRRDRHRSTYAMSEGD